MCSYNSVCLDCDPEKLNHTGIPSCAYGALQNGMLREEWGFEGFVVSDCDAVGNIRSPHFYTPDFVTAAAAGLNGGTDVDCGTTYSVNLLAALSQGLVSLATLQLAATRLLTAMFALGSIMDPGASAYDAYGADRIDSPQHRALALQAAVQGIVLLRNNATGTPWGPAAPLLPLRLPSLKRLAVIGPLGNATQALLSNYEGGNELVEGHSILQAIASRAGAGVAVTHAVGCTNSSGLASVWCGEATGFPAAVEAARGADVAVVVVGLCSICPDGWRLEGEGHDRHALGLPGMQEELIAAVVATGTPVVLVLVHGGPLALAGSLSHATILDAHVRGSCCSFPFCIFFLPLSAGAPARAFTPARLTQRPPFALNLTVPRGAGWGRRGGHIVWRR